MKPHVGRLMAATATAFTLASSAAVFSAQVAYAEPIREATSGGDETIGGTSIASAIVELSSYKVDWASGGTTLPTITSVKLGESTLAENTDYTATCNAGNNPTPGKYKYIITGKGSYSGSVEEEFVVTDTITGITLSGEERQIYTGSVIHPGVTVTAASGEVPSSNYTVTYPSDTDCTNIGAGKTITVTGSGDIYTGSANASFSIVGNLAGAADLGKPTIEFTGGPFYFTGLAVTVSESNVIVRFGTTQLAGSTDFTLSSFANNTAPGTGTFNIVAAANGLATGTASGVGFDIVGDLSGATVTLSDPNPTYSGQAIKPFVTSVALGSHAVPSDAYKVDYPDTGYTNAGEHRVTVTAVEDKPYANSYTQTFNIAQLALTSADFKVSGTTNNPTVTNADGKNFTLAKAESGGGTADAVWSAGDNGTITVQTDSNNGATGNCSGGPITLTKPSIGGAVVSGIEAAYDYTSQAIEPKPTVTLGGTQLVENKDYVVEYSSDHTNVGQNVTVTVKAAENSIYQGTVTQTATFKIVGNLAKATVATAPTYTYDGTSHVPSASDFALKFTGSSDYEIENTNYTVALADDANSTNAGSPSVVISPAEGSLYTNSKTTTYTINKLNLSTLDESDFQVESSATSPYEPVVTLNPNGAAKDITLAKEGSSKSADAYYQLTPNGTTNSYDVSIVSANTSGGATATGNCENSRVLTTPDVSGAELTGINDVYLYTGSAIEPKPTVKLGDETLVLDKDYTVSYAGDTTNPGTVTLTVTGRSRFKGTKTNTYQIHRAIADATVTPPADVLYTGASQALAPTVTYNNANLTEGTSNDYTFTPSSDTTNPGEVTITITGHGVWTGTTTTTYQILGDLSGPSAAATPSLTLNQDTVTSPGVDTYYYRGAPIKPSVATNGMKLDTLAVPSGAYAATYAGEVTAITAGTKPTITLTATGTGDGLYYRNAHTKDYTIVARPINDAAVTRLSWSQNPSVAKPLVSVSEGSSATTPQSFPGVVLADAGNTSVTAKPDGWITYDTTHLTTSYVTYKADTARYTGGTPVTVSSGGVGALGVGTTGNLTGADVSFTPANLFADPTKYSLAFDTATSGFQNNTYHVYDYTGTPREPHVTLKYEGATLTEGVDYQLLYHDNVEVGYTTVAIMGLGIYQGVQELGYTIRHNLSNATVYVNSQVRVFGEANPSEYEYQGQAITPTAPSAPSSSVVATARATDELTVSIGDYVIPGNQYLVTYTDEAGKACAAPQDPGRYTVHVKPKDATPNASLVGEATGSFVIYANLARAGHSLITNGAMHYTGAPITPPMILTVKGSVDPSATYVVPASAYTVSATNNVARTNAAQATATPTAATAYKFKNSITAPFSIQQRDLSDASTDTAVSLAGGTRHGIKADGSVPTPAPVFSDTTGIAACSSLAFATDDYRVDYLGYVASENAYRVRVTGSSANVTGTRDLLFSLSSNLSEAQLSVAKQTFAGTAVTPPASDVTLTIGTTPVPLDQVVMELENNTAPGRATLTVRPAEGSDYQGSKSANFVIEGNLADATVTTDQPSYVLPVGGTVTPRVVVSFGDTVVPASAYSVTITNNAAAGTGHITISPALGQSAYVGTKTVDFTILAKSEGGNEDKDPSGTDIPDPDTADTPATPASPDNPSTPTTAHAPSTPDQPEVTPAPIQPVEGDTARGHLDVDPATGKVSVTLSNADGTPSQGWQTVGGKTMYATNGTASQGATTVDGKTYVFAQDGGMQTGLASDPNTGATYYASPQANDAAGIATGEVWKNGWLDTPDGRVYASSTGELATGWFDDPASGAHYYFFQKDDPEATGTAAAGRWLYVEESDGWYVAQATGEIVVGWARDGSGDWYYFEPTNLADGAYGKMATGWVYDGTIDAWFYAFRPGDNGVTGVVARDGWILVDGEWYYCSPDNGAIVTGWKFWDNNWFYFSTRRDGTYGMLQREWFQDTTGNWFLSDRDYGAIKSSWQMWNNRWFHLHERHDGAFGVMDRGWYWSDGWYYLGGDGAMLVNAWTPDGYWVGADGKL